MFIDIHAHVQASTISLCRKSGEPWYAKAEELIAYYDKIGIAKAVLLPELNPELAVMQSTDEIIEVCKRRGDRFIPFCNIDPRGLANSPFSNFGDIMRQYKDLGCRGIGEICANLPFLDPLMQNLFRHAQNAKLPVLFHLSAQLGGSFGDFSGYGIYDDPGLPQLDRSLAIFPELVFIGHSQPFWAEIGRLEKPGDRYGHPQYPVKEEGVVPKLMRQYKNLYGDLSADSGFNALMRDPGYAVKFLNEFQDRLMFGTDLIFTDNPLPKFKHLFNGNNHPLIDFLCCLKNEGKIPEKAFKKITGENASRLLGL